ncbi:MAG: hypothetical protein IPK13_01370 [Deltaproteobacteria bacterium]|nr:hypothetical protein [Deltaproteobacteria bacterium]
MQVTLQGLNQSVDCDGRVYHVQTEHIARGGEHQVVSQVFIDGCVLSSRSSTHGGSSPIGKSIERLRQALSRQHEMLVKELRRGDFDEGSKPTGSGDISPLQTADIQTLMNEIPPEAASHFVQGCRLVHHVKAHWRTANELAPNRRELLMAEKLINKLGEVMASACDCLAQASMDVIVPNETNLHVEGKTPSAALIETQDVPRPYSTTDTLQAIQDPSEHVPASFSNAKYKAAEFFESGQAAMRSGRKDEALGFWEEAATLDPSNERYRTCVKKLKGMLVSAHNGRTGGADRA